MISEGEFKFQMSFVPLALIFIYGMVIIVPLLFGLLMKCFESKISILEVMSIYGYSMFIYIPAFLICIYPSKV